MSRIRKKLTSAQKAERKRRKAEFMTIFVNGKQKRIRRPPLIEGMDADEFIRWNADPVWLHQHALWECIEPPPGGCEMPAKADGSAEDEIPF
jgi:hypothetical protein